MRTIVMSFIGMPLAMPVSNNQMLFALRERSQFHLPICMREGNACALLPGLALDNKTKEEKCNNKEQTSG